MIFRKDEKVLKHYGTPRHSGRYPWGSGEDPFQRTADFRGNVLDLKKKGLTEKEIADGFGMSIKDLRNKITLDKNAQLRQLIYQADTLKAKGYSSSEIGRMMNRNESTIREWLNPLKQEKAKVLESTTNMLKDQLQNKPMLDVGLGVELDVGVKRTMLDAAIYDLEQQGYKKHLISVEQLGTGKKTYTNVLTKDDISTKDVYDNRDKIRTVSDWTEDGGETYLRLEPVKSLDSKRVMVRFDEDGGSDMDGTVQLRRGVKDLSLGDKQYAQVRIEVDDNYFMKGMAIYSDDLPDGVDVIYNSSKSKSVGKEGAFKKNESEDPTNPFGTTIRQQKYLDEDGKEQLSPLNRVGYSQTTEAGEQGYWDTWHSGKALASQFLSKQPVDLAKQQLNIDLEIQQNKYEDISKVTNSAVKQRLLDSFADDCDSKAVHLEGAALPRQSSKVLLPIPSLKDNEVYAPSYNNGEEVLLIRYPHAGTFEIPKVRVNNKNLDGLNMFSGEKVDAIGINPKTAAKLSGADFDGDSVIVIPNSPKLVSSDALQGLKDFDPKKYKLSDDVTQTESFKDPKSPFHKMTDREKGLEMGGISNLITDMSIKGATPDELARAVRHSMVVIDAQKHNLDYKASAVIENIKDLKREYQGKPNAGASTLLSRATAETRPDATRPLKKGDPGYENVVRRNEYSIDKETGQKVFAKVESREPYINKDGKMVVPKTPKKISTRMYDTEDAKTLFSENPTSMEIVYANYANSMKNLGNQARKESAAIKPTKYSPSAKAAYSEEVKSLDAKVQNAQRNAPKERSAQFLANSIVDAKKVENPNLTPSQLKKIRGQALETARLRVGAGKQRIDITSKEWEAIQSGAVTYNKLQTILNNSKIEDVQKLATPRPKKVIPDSKIARAKSMLRGNYTLAEVAEALGLSVSTLSKL